MMEPNLRRLPSIKARELKIQFIIVSGEEMDERESKIEVERNKTTDRGGGGGVGKAVAMGICGTLVYYHCAFGNSSLLSLIADVLIVLLCSLAILGLLFRQLNISVPVDPLEWQISQDAANTMVAGLANTIGAAESVLRVAATGHDKRLFVKVVICLYILSALGRLVSGITVAYAGLCLLCLYMLAENSQSIGTCLSWFLSLRNAASVDADSM